MKMLCLFSAISMSIFGLNVLASEAYLDCPEGTSKTLECEAQGFGNGLYVSGARVCRGNLGDFLVVLWQGDTVGSASPVNVVNNANSTEYNNYKQGFISQSLSVGKVVRRGKSSSVYRYLNMQGTTTEVKMTCEHERFN
ncbi:MAG: hypothetical protein SGJ18_16570 [Pseudomonadota bacterium]|nr:hypothetical protein [Pseudomonadota bacterium]